MKLIAILTPAKTLTSRKIPSDTIASTTPLFQKRTKTLIESLKKMSQARLKSLLKVSDKIAALNYARYQNYHKNESRPCILTFDGAAHRYVFMSKTHRDAQFFFFKHQHSGDSIRLRCRVERSKKSLRIRSELCRVCTVS